MKFCCPCCTNQVAPAAKNDCFTFDVGPETHRRDSQEFTARNGASTSAGSFQSDGESREQSSTECFPEIRVDKCDGASLPRNESFRSRWRIGMDNGILPPAFQMLLLSWIQPMDSKANAKLFGSAKAVKHEQTRHKQAGWIIHPCSAFRSVFTIIILVDVILHA